MDVGKFSIWIKINQTLYSDKIKKISKRWMLENFQFGLKSTKNFGFFRSSIEKWLKRAQIAKNHSNHFRACWIYLSIRSNMPKC
jgi:hypothetical protein